MTNNSLGVQLCVWVSLVKLKYFTHTYALYRFLFGTLCIGEKMDIKIYKRVKLSVAYLCRHNIEE